MSRKTDAEQVAATLGQLLLRANRAHLYRGLVQDSAVDETTYPVLSGLGRLGSVTATELAEQIGLDRTVTTRYATRLEQAGLIERRAHPDDARATVLTLSRRGRSRLAAMRERLAEVVVASTAQWSAAELHTFTRLLDELSVSLRSRVATDPS